LKRTIVVGLAGALCFCCVALGATVHYKGRDRAAACKSIGPPKPCLITFDGRTHKGRVKTVKKFLYGRIPTTCTAGPSTTDSSGHPMPPMGVNHKRKFHGEASIQNGASKVSVTGKFSKSFGKATGTLRVKSNRIGGAFTCDTGPDRYKVRR
jgi:hypothetical protein